MRNETGIQFAKFVVGPVLKDAQVWCVWEWDLGKRNLHFLERLDPDYFDYLIDLHVEHLERDDAARAALGIRTAYHHALETLFTLLCATAQAHTCVAAWIPKCKTEQLRSLVKAISYESSVPNTLGLDVVSWRSLAEVVSSASHPDPEERRKNAERFGRLWGMLAHDLLDGKAIEEFNSLKHGFRVHPGGFTLSIGVEQSPGVLAPGEAMKTIGHSRFGSSFFVPEKIMGAPDSKKDPHFRIRRHSLNWDPICNAHATKLATMSMRNLVSFLRIAHGVKPETVRFTRPADPTVFDAPWATNVGVTSMNFDQNVREEDIKRCSANEIRNGFAKPAIGKAPDAQP